MIRSARSSACGRSSRTSASGSTGGPSSSIADPGREVRRRGREEVAAVEGAGDRVERVVRVRELVRRLDPRSLGGRDQEAVVRPDVAAPIPVAECQRPPGTADTRVDDRKVAPDRHVRDRVREHERALQDLLRRDPMGDVDDLRLGRDPLDHAVARADEVVLKAEVAQEGDEHAAEPRCRREQGRRRRASSAGLAHRRRRRDSRRAACVVCGPMVTAGMSAPRRPNARAADAEASTTRSPAGATCGVSSRVR